MQRSGEYISNLSGEAMYKSFRPAPLPPAIDKHLVYWYWLEKILF